MKLKEMMDKGYKLRAWTLLKVRNERRFTVKLSKKAAGRERFYVVHSPEVEKLLADVEFTAPVLLEGV